MTIYIGYPKTTSIVIGSVHAVLGLTIIVIQIITLAIDSEHGKAYLGQGIWCGAMYVIAGILGILAGRKAQRGLVVASLVLCVASFVLNVLVFLTTLIWIIISSLSGTENEYNFHSTSSCYSSPYFQNNTCTFNGNLQQCIANGTKLNNYTCFTNWDYGTSVNNPTDKVLWPFVAMILVNFVEFFLALTQSILACIGASGQTDEQAQTQRPAAGVQYSAGNQTVAMTITGPNVGTAAPQQMMRLPNGQYAVLLGKGGSMSQNQTAGRNAVAPAPPANMLPPPYSSPTPPSKDPV